MGIGCAPLVFWEEIEVKFPKSHLPIPHLNPHDSNEECLTGRRDRQDGGPRAIHHLAPQDVACRNK